MEKIGVGFHHEGRWFTVRIRHKEVAATRHVGDEHRFRT
jgi:hypothetical protein